MREQQELIKKDQQQIKADQLAMKENIRQLITSQHLIIADQGLITEELSNRKEEIVQMSWDLRQIRTAQQVYKDQLLRIKAGQERLNEMLKSLNSV